MADVTVQPAVSASAAYGKKILWTLAVVVVTAVASILQNTVPAIQEITPSWLDGLVAMIVPIVVATLLKFANNHHKDAVEEALYTPVPKSDK